jgi:hypothetical protein
MILSQIRSMSLEALRDAIAARMSLPDESVATARAYRVMCRLNGYRITLAEASKN